ncbi:hypothetical protein [Xanthomonas sp. MUS 060]|uniref:hypothetical protein n=1 Tax=Xanthomonas sp. MUS 060 TaxID=1588031 RepID=UPI001269A15F|nr:hypothetical protein [Xanthomonas sp. MUS 060]
MACWHQTAQSTRSGAILEGAQVRSIVRVDENADTPYLADLALSSHRDGVQSWRGGQCIGVGDMRSILDEARQQPGEDRYVRQAMQEHAADSRWECIDIALTMFQLTAFQLCWIGIGFHM